MSINLINVNVGEWGINFYFSTGFDMSANTALKIVFTKPDNTTLTVTNPDVTAPGSPVTLPNGQTFNANEYMLYTFKAGDLDVPGTWSARAFYTDASQMLNTKIPANFTVDP